MNRRGDPTASAQFSIGTRLRDLRKQANMTLTTLAEGSGISVSTLSKIENDKVSPTFANLLRLAESFDMPLSNLIGEVEQKPAPTARIAITRASEIAFARTQTYDMGPLCTDLRGKKMSPFLDRIHANTVDVGDLLVRHEGEEFVYVLSGVLEIHTEHYQPIELRAGDSAYMDSQMAHCYRSGTDEPAEMLMVWLPPDTVRVDNSSDVLRAIAQFYGPDNGNDAPLPEKATARQSRLGR